MVEDSAEQRVIERICALHHEGRSLRETARALRHEGIMCRGRVAWHHKTIRAALKRRGAL